MILTNNKKVWSPKLIDNPNPLTPTACHVWLLPLQKEREGWYEQYLSPSEQLRAARLTLPAVYHQFVATRSLVRQLLSHYLNLTPWQLEFATTPLGKPYLINYPDFQFSISHAGEYAVCAITTLAATGIDIESLRFTVDYQRIVKRFFSAEEQKSFNKIARDYQRIAFFKAWCLKEALVKTYGIKLVEGLKQFDIGWNESGDIQQINPPIDHTEFIELPPIPNFESSCVILSSLAKWEFFQGISHDN